MPSLEDIQDKLDEFPVQILYSAQKGRYIVSRMDLGENTLVFRVR